MRDVDEQTVEAMGVRAWPTWDSGVKTFAWEYSVSSTRDGR